MGGLGGFVSGLLGGGGGGGSSSATSSSTNINVAPETNVNFDLQPLADEIAKGNQNAFMIESEKLKELKQTNAIDYFLKSNQIESTNKLFDQIKSFTPLIIVATVYLVFFKKVKK